MIAIRSSCHAVTDKVKPAIHLIWHPKNAKMCKNISREQKFLMLSPQRNTFSQSVLTANGRRPLINNRGHLY